MGILGAMMFVRFGLEPLVKTLRNVFKASGPWEKSSEYHILREVRPSHNPSLLPSGGGGLPSGEAAELTAFSCRLAAHGWQAAFTHACNPERTTRMDGSSSTYIIVSGNPIWEGLES